MMSYVIYPQPSIYEKRSLAIDILLFTVVVLSIVIFCTVYSSMAREIILDYTQSSFTIECLPQAVILNLSN